MSYIKANPIPPPNPNRKNHWDQLWDYLNQENAEAERAGMDIKSKLYGFTAAEGVQDQVTGEWTFRISYESWKKPGIIISKVGTQKHTTGARCKAAAEILNELRNLNLIRKNDVPLPPPLPRPRSLSPPNRFSWSGLGKAKSPLDELRELVSQENVEAGQRKLNGEVVRNSKYDGHHENQGDLNTHTGEWTFCIKYQSWKTPDTVVIGVGINTNKYAAKCKAAEQVLNKLRGQGSGNPNEAAAGRSIGNLRFTGDWELSVVVQNAIFYSPTSHIGTGNMGTIFRGYYETPNNLAAVKRLPKDGRVKDRLGEIDLLMKLRNKPNVVNYFGSETGQDGCTYVAMELASCDLEKYLGKEILPLGQRKKLLSDIAKGLQTLHNEGIIHRDLKPQNILIFGDVSSGNVAAKLADFGISRQYDNIYVGDRTMVVGSPKWMTPESRSGKVAYYCDIHCLGQLAFYIMSTPHTHPFELNSPLNPYKPRWESLYNPKSREEATMAIPLVHLLKAMLHLECEKRPKVEVLLEHPFFWSGERFVTFIERFSTAMKEDKMMKRNLSSDYEMFMTLQFSVPYVNWKYRLTPEYQDFLKKSTHRQVYDASDLTSLVDCIRDKNVHYPEWKKLNYRFPEDNKGYGEYFMNMFPELGIFLFTSIQNGNIPTKLQDFYVATRNPEINGGRFETMYGRVVEEWISI